MNSKKHHILIIDDDKEISELISTYLSQHGFRCTYALNGLNIKSLLREHNFDLVILDIMLPGTDGLSLCQMIRENHNLPIIMLSAANSTADRVAGLELGADDYISKPFSSRELLARVKAQLRRTCGELSSDSPRLAPLKQIKFAGWILDRDTHSLIDKDDIAIPLSQKEYELLLIFLEHPQRILSRDQLMDLLYDKHCDPQDRTIDVLIGRLRKKLEIDSRNPHLLLTIRGGGYQLKGKVTTI
ncbi:response regulator transcription factor [Legionella jordanis]|uniref:DNA-binding response regulator in two-component regulatory system with EnvZ n=1 Tax=Legionella jordanis TaxID=456 RepID=A0A0W0VCA9_9GAMM|nr:response regulator transcription factor [Legionella jordanis]KTD17747.1 DNA-binding response regulator in two-component regulatory system with EnvZ [Legionella jordanis]RMX01610.1 DNA-binding response regulator [Legionella jordanis]RMX21606.1 DNA-binding response regulator [Legionella jordanis]VEH11318.1 DNA-binding response regulator in two-component regulatory system with EnvZ [Legionella jordanis]HAT8714519.1 response regulator [Legionella jordanis]